MIRRPLAGTTALTLAVALLAAPFAAAREVPYLSGRVNDTADMIPAEVEQRLEEKLAALEESTGAQMAVLTIDSLEGAVLEEFSLAVAETWGLGRAEQDDGVLMLIARDDRKMRIEVGYGLEGDLTDAQAGRILNNIVKPAFRAGDFGGGIEAGVDAVIGTLQGEDVIPPDTLVAAPSDNIFDAPILSKIFFLGIFLLVVGSFSMIALFTGGCHSWFLWLFLTPFWTFFPMVLDPAAGLVCGAVWFVGCPIVKLILGKTDSGKRFLEAYPWLATVGSGGSSGGGWSGGSGGGFSGGFSGGGGSFGGGGASSSW